MPRIGRNGVAGILVVLAALLVPATAFAGVDLKIYKQEAQVDLSADEATFSVNCQPGDHALDGMWRIDHVDQDLYIADLDNLRTGIDVTSAIPSDNGYTFTFEKNAIGNAQAKIFVTCLGNVTDGGSTYTYTFPSSNPNAVFTQYNGTTPANTTASFSTVAGTATNAFSLSTPVSTSSPSHDCPSGTFLVSPGFKLDNWTDGASHGVDPTPQAGRLIGSTYGSSLNSWNWYFDFSSLPPLYTADYTTYYRCLKIKVNPNGHPKHHLVVKLRPSVTANISAGQVKEVQYTCKDLEKAMVAGFKIASPYNIWYLGMDPRPKTRAFRFLNAGPGTQSVTLKAACLNYRTS